MHSIHDVDYDDIDTAISQAGIDLSASEVHGVICGAICNQMKTGTAPDMKRLITAGSDLSPGSVERLQQTLETLLRGTLEDLHRDEGNFDLLLPDDDDGLRLRLTSLADWCRGFLLGLLDGQQLAIDEFGTDAGEIARDMLSVSELEAGGDDSEWDLNQVEEYVRVGVQLIFEELYGDLHGGVESEALH